MCTGTFGKFGQKQSRDGDRQCGKADASKDGVALLVHQRRVNPANGGGFESNYFSDTGTGSIRQSDWRA